MAARDNACGPGVRVWTMSTAGLDEAAVASWRGVLDAGERARADRFAFAEGRIAFTAAHALARAALGACTGYVPAAFAFTTGVHGKPEAVVDGRPAGVAFNLSHTRGAVGVAVAAGEGPVGFDLEPLARRAPLGVARRWFTAEERGWLEGLPEGERGEGFLRLWTLKEAFIKATGKGLTQDLSSFWFVVSPPAIRFAATLPGRPEDWWFAQRVVHGEFVAVVAVYRGGAGAIEAAWRAVDPGGFRPMDGNVLAGGSPAA
jgi:4'-phosphopantetheinyl transferase